MSLEPDLILIWLQTGNPPVVKGSGRRVRRDETVGSLRVNAPWAVLDDLPDWARKLAGAALAEHGLSGMWPGSTVPERCAAGDHSLCLIPDESTGCPGFTPSEGR